MRRFSLILLLISSASLAWPDGLSPKPQLLLQQEGRDAKLTIVLGEKWKTYSTRPQKVGVPPSGVLASGVPPKLDWSRSSNLKDARAVFPMPEKLSTLGTSFWGYRNLLILPIKIEPKDKRRAVRLRLTLSYVICDTICVPLEEKLTLILPPNDKV